MERNRRLDLLVSLMLIIVCQIVKRRAIIGNQSTFLHNFLSVIIIV